MKQNGSMALFQYWNRLRDGRPAPKRTEIEPADIKGLLADTFILERDSRGEAVFRLAGTRLCATFGRELKGFSFPSLWRPKDQRLIARLAYGVFQQKSVVVITFDGFTPKPARDPLRNAALAARRRHRKSALPGRSVERRPAVLARRRSSHRRLDRMRARRRSGRRAGVPEQPAGDHGSVAGAERTQRCTASRARSTVPAGYATSFVLEGGREE